MKYKFNTGPAYLYFGRYYGCGPVFPTALKGASVLDLGSGSGQDCYVLSKLVGPEGRVVGLDMTDEQVKLVFKYSCSLS